MNIDSAINEIERMILSALTGSRLMDLGTDAMRSFYRGKFLRSRLGLTLAGERITRDLVTVCSVVELVHSASLIHDDIIDRGQTRRGKPTWSAQLGPSSAVILGDYLFCTGLRLLAGLKSDNLGRVFAAKLQEMCEGEFEQECLFRGQTLTLEQCCEINRKKTGALFAMVSLAAAGDDPQLGPVLEKVGYITGTVYQYIDDLLDEFSTEERTGKTLGSDRRRNKPTAVKACLNREAELINDTRRSLASARESLTPWPHLAAGYDGYIAAWFEPYLNEVVQGLAWRTEQPKTISKTSAPDA